MDDAILPPTKFSAFLNVRLSRRLAIALALALALAAGCAPEQSPEQQVRAVIAAAEEGAEARDVSAVMSLVSDDYTDGRGRDRNELQRFIRGYFILNQSIGLLTRVENLEFPADELARARVTVGMLGRRGDAEDWSLAAELHAFDVELLNEDGEWRLLRAERVR